MVFDAFHAAQKHRVSRPRRLLPQICGTRPDEVRRIALNLWREINLKNLEENILPTRRRAQLILQKGESHRVEVASLRKL